MYRQLVVTRRVDRRFLSAWQQEQQQEQQRIFASSSIASSAGAIAATATVLCVSIPAPSAHIRAAACYNLKCNRCQRNSERNEQQCVNDGRLRGERGDSGSSGG